MSVMRAVSVPLGITTPDQPNISSTMWRTVSDQKNLVYYFDLGDPPQHLLGVLRQDRPEGWRPGEEAHHPERRGLLRRDRGPVQARPKSSSSCPRGPSNIMRIGIDLGGTKIEGLVLGDDGTERARLRVPTPQDSYEATVGAVVGVVRELEKQGRRALPRRHRPSRRALSRHGPGQERQLDAAERPAARRRPEARAGPRRRAPVQRRQLLRRLRGGRRCGRRRPDRVRRNPRHRRGRRHRDRRQAAGGRPGDRRRMGPQRPAPAARRRASRAALLLRAIRLRRSRG